MGSSLPSATTAPRGLPQPNMIRWPLVAARNLFELKYGKALVEADRRPGKVPVYGTNGRCGSHDEALFKGPGVILGRKGQGPLGVEWSESDYWVIDTAYSLAPLRADIDLRYAYFLIKLIGLNHLKDGTSNPSLSRETFGAQALPLPPLAEQRAIAHILGTLDDKIKLNRRMNETLEAMTRAIFKSWFVDFDPVRAKAEGRDTGLPKHIADLFPDRFEVSDLGELPAGWQVRSIGNVIERLSVGKKYEQKTVNSSGKVPVLDQGKSGIIGYHDDDPGVIASAEHPVVIFANHTCHMRLVYFPFSAIQNVLPFVGKGVNTLWTFFSTLGKQNFTEYKGHWPDFITHKIVVPDPKLTNEFSRLVDPLLKKSWLREGESRTLVALRDTLLPKLTSGELRLQEAERFLEGVGA
jgi:type I restriction enzyme S subunit